MKKNLKRILTAALALLMTVTVINPETVFAKESDSKNVTLTATTESGIYVTVTGSEKVYSEGVTLIANDVAPEEVLKNAKREVGTDEVAVQAVDLSYRKDGKIVSISPSGSTVITFSGIQKNAAAVLHITSSFLWTKVEGIDFTQTGDEVSFVDNGVGRYVVVYDKSLFEFVSDENDSDTKVSVVAEKDTFETGTEMTVSNVEAATIEEAVKEVLQNGEIVGAVDISFEANGESVQPTKDVTVTIETELDPSKTYMLVHIHDDGTVEEVNDAVFADGCVTFTATSFSIYAVVTTDDPVPNSRLSIVFHNVYYNGQEEVDEIITTVYVKNSDKNATNAEELIKTIVYDPGLGTHGKTDEELFHGWCFTKDYNVNTDIFTIEELRKHIISDDMEDWSEGDTLDVYAAIFAYHNIVFLSPENDVVLGTDNLLIPRNATTGVYPIPYDYTPDSETKLFAGWKAVSGGENIIDHTPIGSVVHDKDDDAILYQLNDKVTLKGDIVLKAREYEGHWLVFDENGKGATYIAPQFVLTGEGTQNPNPTAANPDTGIPMTRNGYTFDGWYYGVYDEDGKLVKDDNGYADLTNATPFTFGNEIEEKTFIYAKWTPKTSASYTILVWKQNLNGNGYDFADAQIISNGTVGETVGSISLQGSGDNTYVTVSGGNPNRYQYTGFHVKEFDTGVEIVPEGTAVVNVYFDRNIYTLLFEAQRTSGTHYRYSLSDEGSYGSVNGEFVELGEEVISTYTVTEYFLVQTEGASYDQRYNGTVYDANGRTVSNREYPTTYYRREWVGGWGGHYEYYELFWNSREVTVEVTAPTYTDSEGNTKPYIGPRFDRTTVNSGNGWYTVKAIVALYGQSIQNQFPISDAYPTGTRWNPTSTLTVDGVTYFTQNTVIAYVDTMTPGNMTFQYSANPTRPGYEERTMNYWTEALPGVEDDPSDPDTTTYKGKVYEKYETVKAVYYGVTIEDFIELIGFEHFEADKYLRDPYYHDTNSDSGNRSTTVNFYYTRLSYKINYMDGIYVGGNSAAGDFIQDRSTQPLHTSEDIEYGKNIQEYGSYEPTLPAGESGFVFEGWYADKACLQEFSFNTAMPEGGVTVYAKWRQIRYRVFLHPNVPESDKTLDWGSDNQAMNFSIAYGGKVSAPTGLREDYHFQGWFTDAEGKKSFDADSFILNDTTVTTDYDKTTDKTDVMNKYGKIVPVGGTLDNGEENETAPFNSDVNRFWVIKKLDLYGKWSADVPGALGINVQYDATAEGEFVTTEGPSQYSYDHRFYKDNVDAIAQDAPTPTSSTRVFSHWIVQKWSDTEGDFVDTEENVYPGNTFTVLKSNSHVTDITYDSHGDIDSAVYTIQLKAAYLDVEAPTPTHITFYLNGGNFVDGAEMPEKTINGETTVTYPALAINEKVPVLSTDTFEREGFTFVGWARLNEPEGAWVEGTDGNTVDETKYEETSKPELWLKLNSDGTYTEVGTSNNEVVEVAADENKPYHALYAVWEKTFFVYHSSSKVLEAVTIDTEKFDITEKVANNHIYGGYFKSYGGVAVTEENKESALQNGTLTISNAEIYDGSSLTATDGTKFWSKRVKVDSEYVDNYYAENGKTMVPVSGTVYYLKEVPAAYLSNNVKYVQNIDTKIISDLYLLTTVDDILYNEFGYEIEVTVDDPTSETVVLFNTVTIQQRGLSGDKSTVKVFQAGTTGSDTPLNTGISRGYIGYLKKTVSSIKESTDTELAFVLRPYWTTLDGVVVHGVERTYTIGSGNTTISAE